MKPKIILQKELKEELKTNIIELENFWFTHKQIWEIMWDYKQVVSNLKNNPDYPLWIEKAKRLLENINNFKQKEEYKNLINKS